MSYRSTMGRISTVWPRAGQRRVTSSVASRSGTSITPYPPCRTSTHSPPGRVMAKLEGRGLVGNVEHLISVKRYDAPEPGTVLARKASMFADPPRYNYVTHNRWAASPQLSIHC